MDDPIEPGCIVVCIEDRGTYGTLVKGMSYTVERTNCNGFAVYLEGIVGPYRRDRFELLYQFDETDPEPNDEGAIDEDH